MTSVDDLLADQAGVISRPQALAAGLSPDAVDHRLRTRRWRPLHPRVYLAAGHRLGDEARVRAALGWAGQDAILSGAAAAWWHGVLAEAPPVVGVTVGRRRNPRPRSGVAVRRRDVPATDVGHHRGLAVTALPLTVLEAAVELGPAGGPLLDRALQRYVSFRDVQAAHRRNLGAQGSGPAGRLLGAAADRSAAATGRLLVRLLGEAGLHGWHRVPARPAAVAFPRARVVVEVAGWAWHVDPEHRPGPTVLRLDWRDLASRPQAVIVEVRRALAVASAGCA